LILLLTLFSGLSCLAFGFGYLASPKMRRDFDRYGVGHLKVLLISLQLAGAVGELVGVAIPALGGLAAAGLAMMMFVAIVLRISIGDSPLKCLPAAIYLLINVYLFCVLI
jgi:hypothetical protein